MLRFKSVINLLMLAASFIGYSIVMAQPSANVQVVHNCPDAPAVDIVVNGNKVLNNVSYKQASNFLQVIVLPMTNTTVQVALPQPGPTIGTIIFTKEFTLQGNEDYIVMAGGLLNGTPNFDLFAYNITNTPVQLNETVLEIVHGSPNAPAVGVVARGVATLVSDFSFGDYEGGLAVPSNDYVVDIRAGNSVGAVVASFSAPLSGFAGQRLAVLATGTFPGTFGLLAIDNSGTVVQLPAPTPAKVQVVHNSPNAPAVNVLINGNTVTGLTNVPYKAASSFLDVPLFPFPTTVQIAVASNNQVVVTNFLEDLEQGKFYRAIANGLVGSTVSGQELDVDYYEATTTTTTGQTGLDIIHGSPNAPTVGVVARNVTTLVSAFSFRDIGTVSVPSSSYIIDVNAGNAGGSTAASFSAPLNAFAGQNIAVIATGTFPGTFGLMAVAANGNVIQLPTAPGPNAAAKVQVIHNSPNAPNVDVVVNGVKALSDVAYKTASGFVSIPVLPSPTTVQIAVVTPGTVVGAIVFTKTFSLTDGANLRIVASGLLNGTPAFDLVAYNANVTTTAGQTGLDIIHSSPNAPTVGVVARDVATLVSSFSFPNQAGFVSVASQTYTLDINAGNAGGATAASFTAPLGGFAGQNIAVLATGTFPGTFGLVAFGANGGAGIVLSTTTAPLPAPAKVQVVHNSPGAPAVDVWVNNTTVLSGVSFRQASGFLSVTPGVTTVQIAVTGSNPYTIVSTDVITLVSGMSYRAIATGVVGSTVAGQGFGVSYLAATTTTTTGQTGLDIIHSSPDAPTVGVVARGVATLVSAFSFRDNPTFVSVPSAEYTVDINAGDATGATVASFTAPLAGLAGQNIAVIASGLLNGTPAFGLIAVAGNGDVIVLSSPTSVASFGTSSAFSLYPNPAADVVYANAMLDKVEVYDATGALKIADNNVVSLNVSSLVKGMYFVKASIAGRTVTYKLLKE